jgi:hypothetical protein
LSVHDEIDEKMVDQTLKTLMVADGWPDQRKGLVEDLIQRRGKIRFNGPISLSIRVSDQVAQGASCSCSLRELLWAGAVV